MRDDVDVVRAQLEKMNEQDRESWNDGEGWEPISGDAYYVSPPLPKPKFDNVKTIAAIFIILACLAVWGGLVIMLWPLLPNKSFKAGDNTICTETIPGDLVCETVDPPK